MFVRKEWKTNCLVFVRLNSSNIIWQAIQLMADGWVHRFGCVAKHY